MPLHKKRQSLICNGATANAQQEQHGRNDLNAERHTPLSVAARDVLAAVADLAACGSS